ncbi:nicotinate-nucleotide adenylyltransferase [Peribacillus sp. SCS-155]|uniref:nicotinate-nucleotide adenylyltransferase n=1 Tax=Peribacillus sedimenti TaxID=3115297 RepID=UPI00390592B0
MKKIGILGGTFDPPHIGHLIVANEVFHALQLDEIRFMPNHTPPHKRKTNKVSDSDRLNMLKIAVKDHPGFFVEEIELHRDGASFTYDTMVELNSLEPESSFYFIIGADMIEYLPKWHKIDELLQLVQFVGVKRPTYNDVTEYPVRMVDIPEMVISSSMIRDKIWNRQTIKYLLPDSVIKYIEENHLYES